MAIHIFNIFMDSLRIVYSVFWSYSSPIFQFLSNPPPIQSAANFASSLKKNKQTNIQLNLYCLYHLGCVTLYWRAVKWPKTTQLDKSNFTFPVIYQALKLLRQGQELVLTAPCSYFLRLDLAQVFCVMCRLCCFQL